MSGFLVFASRWVVHPTSFGAAWNLFLTGIAVMVVAFTASVAHGNLRRNIWSAVNVIAGIWLIISVSVIPNDPAMSWPQICLGIMIVTTAFTSLSNERLYTRRILSSNRDASAQRDPKKTEGA